MAPAEAMELRRAAVIANGLEDCKDPILFWKAGSVIAKSRRAPGPPQRRERRKTG